MNISQWIEKVIHSDKRCAMPLMTHPGIELSNERIIQAVTNGETHYKAMCALNKMFPQAIACTTIMDLTVEAEAFGAPLHMEENEVPTVKGRLVSTLEDIEKLAIPSLRAARIPQYLKANLLAASTIEKPIFAGCIGPYTLAGRLFDMTEIMIAIYIEPQTVMLLLEKCTEYITQYCQKIKETGVAGVIMAEPAAGLLSNEDCYKFSSIYIKRIIEMLQDDSFIFILHNCGNTGHCTPAMIATRAKGYHFGDKANMVEALQICPHSSLVMGNIDPVGILKMGTPQQVEENVRTLLRQTKAWKNFILSTGCEVPPNTPINNIQAFYRALQTDGEL